MTTSQYENLIPREAADATAPRLFSFARIRGGVTTRFYPGDGARLHFANRDVDTLELPGVPSGYLAAGDVVTAHYRGLCVFRGDVATIVESKHRGTDATQTVTCVGPWSKMQRLVYRQQWKSVRTANDVSTLGDDYSSRLILNQTLQGAAQQLDSELYEIANHGATACGYSVSRQDVSVSTQILPSDECRDITVADAIKRELRFFPKAICRFDYSGETPALKILKNTSPSTASYVADIPKEAREYVYNAHPITGVDLEIEATGTIEGVEYHQISHQKAGDTQAGNPDCLYATLQIKGASASTTRQSFKSVTEDIPTNLNDKTWWKERHPRLANVAESAITISEATRTPNTYPRISASTAGELEEAGLHCEVSKFTCKATIETADDKEEDVYLTLNYLTTNAEGTAEDPKTYTWVTDNWSESGESVPSGLAETLLAERSGSLLSERLSIRLGDTLPHVGDAIVETSQTSQTSQTLFLQSVDIDCGNLTADLAFGVPEYLTPEDMASLLSGFRNKCTTSSSSLRKTGEKGSDGDTIEMGAIPPLSSSEFAPGTKAKTTIASTGGSGGSITLDSSELDSGDKIAVREVTVTDDNGEEKTVKILASEDFVPGGTSGVKTVNEKDGNLSIVGGKGIDVSTDGKTITITANPDKEEPDPDPNTNCDDHPDSEDGGSGDSGVDAGGGVGGGGYGGGGEGGVPAGGEGNSGVGCETC